MNEFIRRLIERYGARFVRPASAAVLTLALAASLALPAGAQNAPVVSSGTLNAAVATNAACSFNSCVSLAGPMPTQSVCWIEVAGPFVGTLVVEGTLTGAQFATQANITAYGGATAAASITAVGLYQAACAPATTVRMSAYTSGLAKVQIFAANYFLSAATPVTGTVTSSLTGTSTTTAGADAASNTINGLNSLSYNLAFNGTTWDRLRKDTYAVGPLFVATGGSTTNVAITAGVAGPVVVKGSAGRIMRALITTAGTTGNVTIFDNASACSGSVIGVIPGTTADATAAVGKSYDIEMPAAAGITACGAAGSPAATVSFY